MVTKVEGFMAYQQWKSGSIGWMGQPRMVPAPPHGERDMGRSAPSKEGSTIPTRISDRETEKGKGIVSALDSLIDGEGSSGLKKEGKLKQETRRTRQCIPKSKTVPKLQIK